MAEERKVEEEYQSLNFVEHALKRPQMYIGDTVTKNFNVLIYNPQNQKIEYQNLRCNLGLLKIIDEIISNAQDNKQRDPKMDQLNITLNKDEQQITIQNNGRAIPVQIHAETNLYVPEMLFGEERSGSNFDENRGSLGGLNGIGSTLTNVFSTEFIVKVCDQKNKKYFEQTFSNNLRDRTEPIVRKLKAKEKNSVSISFKPDFTHFENMSFDNTLCNLIIKRCYDTAAFCSMLPGKKVEINCKIIDNGNETNIAVSDQVKTFRDYINMIPSFSDNILLEKNFQNKRWQIVIGFKEESYNLSLVNGLFIPNGTHIACIQKQLVNYIKKQKKVPSNISGPKLASLFSIGINCLVNDAEFDSQTKTNLTNHMSQFESECQLSNAQLKEILDDEEVNSYLTALISQKTISSMQKSKGSRQKTLVNIDKLKDAQLAGHKNEGRKCTLILCEGDSAAAGIMCMLQKLGREYYGIYPLKGKPLNVREKTNKVAENKEIQDIMNIVGLQIGTHYDETNIKKLRYGCIDVMGDEDFDGQHIKILILNFIHYFWPELLQNDFFRVQTTLTPLVKMKPKSKNIKKNKIFFTLQAFEKFQKTEDFKKYKDAKYYKGLGTSTPADMREYAEDIDYFRVYFDHINQQDTDTLILATRSIDKKKEPELNQYKKQWINEHNPENYIDFDTQKNTSLYEFIQNNGRAYYKHTFSRALPHMLDGLKVSQRKVLYYLQKKGIYGEKNEKKVASLSGGIIETLAYHHGEASLNETIVNLAQNFVGSNNVQLLVDSGQFGSRELGGEDHAAPRYISTYLHDITKSLFRQEDLPLLEYNVDDDNNPVEPVHFVPVLPTLLVNGSTGIATAYSTSIHNYNIQEIIEYYKRRLHSSLQNSEAIEYEKILPYYKGFTGHIEYIENGFITYGIYEVLPENKLKITELPIRSWTQKYKKFLIDEFNKNASTSEDVSNKKSSSKGAKKTKTKKTETPKLVNSFEELCNGDHIYFVIDVPETINLNEMSHSDIINTFKLSTKFSTNNMHAFNSQNTVAHYPEVSDILEEFYNTRLHYYDLRKTNMLEILESNMLETKNKYEFIAKVRANEIDIRIDEEELIAQLEEMGFDKLVSASSKEANYNYLLNITTRQYTQNNYDKLCQNYEAMKAEFELISGKTIEQLWLDDIGEIEECLEKMENASDQEEV